MSGVDLHGEMIAAAARVRAIHLRHLDALGAPLSAIAALGSRHSTSSASNAPVCALMGCLNLTRTG